MSKLQWIMLILGLLLIVGMYQLPKGVVSNKNKQLNESAKKMQSEDTETDSHNQSLSPEQNKILESLKSQLAIEENTKKKITFADSIANLFKANNRFDSAANYLAFASVIEPSAANDLKAGNGYYEAFRFAVSVDANKADQLGKKARGFYQKVLDKEPANYAAKANMAMTFITDPQPMQGIKLLREILEKDDKNELALFNLGMLSIQSGQPEKAIERFEKILSFNPNNMDATLYLGKSLADSGQKEKAKAVWKKILETKADSLQPYRDTVKDMLKQLDK